MNRFHLAGALWMTITVCVHLFAGGADIYDPLRAAPLAPDVVSTLSVVWHAITWSLVLCSAALVYLTVRSAPAVEVLLGAFFAGFTALFIVYGSVDLGSLWIMPQWIIFGAALVLLLLGRRAR